MDEVLHEIVISGHDHDQIVPMVLHGLQKGLHGLLAEIVALLAGQGVRLVDEQHAAHGLLDHGLGLLRRLSHIAGDQAGAVHFDQMALAQHSDGAVETGQQPGDRGLSGAGVAHEHHVQGYGGNGQPVLLTELADLHEIDQTLHVRLDLFKAHEFVQLGQQLVQVRRVRLLLRLRLGGVGRGRVCLGRLVEQLLRRLVRGVHAAQQGREIREAVDITGGGQQVEFFSVLYEFHVRPPEQGFPVRGQTARG